MNKRVMSLIILVALFLYGCSPATNTPTSASSTGIKITQMDTGLGGSEENPDKQVFSYHITLFNAETVDVVVQWIEPVLAGEMSRRVLTADRRMIIEKTLAPNSYIEINGRFTFDTSGASKTQIMSWEPFLTAITVSSEITLPLQLR